MFANLCVVPEEQVSTALDGQQPASRDAGGGGGGEPIRGQPVVDRADDQEGTWRFSSGNRSPTGLETYPSKMAPSRRGLKGNSSSR
jgi:hypothetical protein